MWKGSWSKENCQGGKHKEAAGGYRSRRVEGVLAERVLRGEGSRRKQQEAIEVEE